MEELDKKIVKEILKTINSTELYGYEFHSSIKERLPDLDSAKLYLIMKNLEEKEISELFQPPIDKGCKVKFQYRVTKKGHKFLKSIE